MSTGARALTTSVLACTLAACDGPLSTLSPAGSDAERVARLFFVMAAGAVVVWALVMGAALYAVVRAGRQHGRRPVRLFVLGGGVALPTLVLAALLAYGLSMLPAMLSTGEARSPLVEVEAEQWWWRVTYPLEDGTRVELANEVRLPIGRRVGVALTSPDVIHSFWIPSLAGKVDAIPGRVTVLGLEPLREGVFLGVCAEYCGLSHALMRFSVVTMEEPAFSAWLVHQAAPARPPTTELARRGAEAFLAYGCGACHAVRGTTAAGRVGPDLTHVGSRLTVSGILENDVEGFRRWLLETEDLKPGVHMPAFDMAPPEDVLAIAAYLEELQ